MICPDCRGRFQVIAFIDAPATIRKILEHLHLWHRPVPPPPAPLLGTKMSELLPGSQPDREPEPETCSPSHSLFLDDVPIYAD